MDENEKTESQETSEVEETAAPQEDAPAEAATPAAPPPAPVPPPEEPKAALPPEETQPSFRERKVLEQARFLFSDVMQIPVGPDGKDFVVVLQAIDEDTKQVLHAERVLVHGKRPSANEVLLHIVRKL